MARERASSAVVELARDGERAPRRPGAAPRVLDVQQRGVAAHQRGGKRVRLGQPAGHRERLVRELGGALRGLGEDEVLREPREHAHAQRAVAGLERREGLLEQVGVGVVSRPGA